MAYFWLNQDEFCIIDTKTMRTSIELNGLPLYSAAKSDAMAGDENLMRAIERLGAKSLNRVKNLSIVLQAGHVLNNSQVRYTVRDRRYKTEKI